MIFDSQLLPLRIEVARQIWEAITIDADQHVLITRFFHNKPVYYLVNLTRYYFGFFNLFHIIALWLGYNLLRDAKKNLKK